MLTNQEKDIPTHGHIHDTQIYLMLPCGRLSTKTAFPVNINVWQEWYSVELHAPQAMSKGVRISKIKPRARRVWGRWGGRYFWGYPWNLENIFQNSNEFFQCCPNSFTHACGTRRRIQGIWNKIHDVVFVLVCFSRTFSSGYFEKWSFYP